MFDETAASLVKLGWKVREAGQSVELPIEIRSRYSWLSKEVWQFVSEFDVILSPDERAWVNTHRDLTGNSAAAFAWNEWEVISLEAARDNLKWRNDTTAFWDKHFPLLMSVKSCYAYFAVCGDGSIVGGEEPDFEETDTVASDLRSFLDLVVSCDKSLGVWI